MREVTDDGPQWDGRAAAFAGVPPGGGAPAAFAPPQTIGRCVEALRAIVGERLA
ncbi:FAD/FMN-containing dehydrogenase, partial [Burkholderia pseudomallei]